ncbi:MAG: methyltransferase domain-containing protein [Chloroflexota bacterium]
MTIDFGKTAADYGQHRQGFPSAFFERLTAMGLIALGMRALDLGTGTGSIARGLALAGCETTGLDIAAPLLEQARRLDADVGVNVSYQVAPAEDTGLPDATFDIVTAGQCWHWFDRLRAADEVMRLLVPGGAVVIAHLDWIPLPGNVVMATEELILKHNPSWGMSGGTGLYPAWLSDLAVAGFSDIQTFSFDLNLTYTHEAWCGRIRASAGVSASLAQGAVAAFDDDLRNLLLRDFAEDPLHVYHRVWAVVGKKPKT